MYSLIPIERGGNRIFHIFFMFIFTQLMNKISTFFKRSNITSYLVVIALTLTISLLLLKNCSPKETVTETNDIAITKIQAIGKMELVKLNIKDVLEYSIKRDYLPDSKILLVVSGEIAGCIDLTKIDAKKIIHTDSLIKITLPKPEICYYKIDHQKSKIYNATTYFMLDNELALTQLVYKRAENYFKSDSLNQIVFKETELNAQKILKPLLESITKKRVEVSFDKSMIKN